MHLRKCISKWILSFNAHFSTSFWFALYAGCVAVYVVPISIRCAAPSHPSQSTLWRIIARYLDTLRRIRSILLHCFTLFALKNRCSLTIKLGILGGKRRNENIFFKKMSVETKEIVLLYSSTRAILDITYYCSSYKHIFNDNAKLSNLWIHDILSPQQPLEKL